MPVADHPPSPPLPPPAAAVSAGTQTLAAAAELQDHLMMASNDLERLQRLIHDAGDSLLTHFHGANGALDGARGPAVGDPEALAGALADAARHLASAITAMQFQDLATQLVDHTAQRLRSCADRLACDTLGADDDDGPALLAAPPLRPNPVTQDEMDAGSVELF